LAEGPTEQDLWLAVPKLRALLGKALFIYGDGSQSRSIRYLEDLIDGSVHMMRSSEGRPVK
jgi:nucleoside-diphosphate-sugar epimerase